MPHCNALHCVSHSFVWICVWVLILFPTVSEDNLYQPPWDAPRTFQGYIRTRSGSLVTSKFFTRMRGMRYVRWVVPWLNLIEYDWVWMKLISFSLIGHWTIWPTVWQSESKCFQSFSVTIPSLTELNQKCKFWRNIRKWKWTSKITAIELPGMPISAKLWFGNKAPCQLGQGLGQGLGLRLGLGSVSVPDPKILFAVISLLISSSAVDWTEAKRETWKRKNKNDLKEHWCDSIHHNCLRRCRHCLRSKNVHVGQFCSTWKCCLSCGSKLLHKTINLTSFACCVEKFYHVKQWT